MRTVTDKKLVLRFKLRQGMGGAERRLKQETVENLQTVATGKRPNNLF